MNRVEFDQFATLQANPEFANRCNLRPAASATTRKRSGHDSDQLAFLQLGYTCDFGATANGRMNSSQIFLQGFSVAYIQNVNDAMRAKSVVTIDICAEQKNVSGK